MKKFGILLFIQTILSIVSGVLISKMSFLGRLGINIAYKEYSVFKSWWKTALILIVIQVVISLVQRYFAQRQPENKSKALSGILLVVAIAGLYATYHDFTTAFSHKILKEKFHLGFYLFWITWMIGNLYFLFGGEKSELHLQDLSNKKLTQ